MGSRSSERLSLGPTAAALGTSLSARQTTDSALRGIVTSLVAVLPAALLIEVGRGFQAAGEPDRVSIGAALGVLVSAALIVVFARRGVGRPGAVGAMAPLILWLPFLELGAAATVCGERAPSQSSTSGSAVLPWESSVITPMLLVPFVLLIPALLAMAVASTRHPRLDPLLGLAALASTVIVGVATVFGLARTGHSDPDTYVARLPVAATLTVGDVLHSSPSFALTDGTRLSYSRNVAEQSCTLSGIVAPAGRWGELSCQPLTVRYDVASDLWTLVDTGSLSQCSAHDPCGFNGKDKKLLLGISTAEVRERIAPPLAWTVSSMLGTAMAAILFALGRRRARAKLTALPRPGTLHANGWATLDDGSAANALQLSLTSPVAPGPVLIAAGEAAAHRSAAYREAGNEHRHVWRRGTLDGLREELVSEAVSLYALALTTALLTGAPLLTWWLSSPQRLG